MEELVTCSICGHQAVTLARHLKASHGVTADVYRARYPGARVRSEACEANRKSAISKSHKDKPRSGLKKTVTCPSCGTGVEVGLTFAYSVHDARCQKCRKSEEDRESDTKWATKVEGPDYVTCVKCGIRADNLTSHVQNEHPELVGCYPGQILASNSKVRDKTYLKGRKLSDEVKAKMSASAGWNRGLTKDTDARVANAAAAMIGRTPWNEGLTKGSHPSLQSTSSKLSQLRGPERYWSNGLKADLSRVDFTPFLDETGAVDRKSMSEAIGVSEITITKYMESIGLRISTKYIDARVERDTQSGRFFEMSRKSAEQTTIRLTSEQLDPYKLKNGRVVLWRAMVGLGHVYNVVKRECDRLGIPTHTWLVRQSICLDAVAKVLGDVTFDREWSPRKFTNPATGHRFRFDGYFPSHDLVVEFNGYQHYVFPSVYVQKEELFFALQERDRVKENLIHSDPTLRYFLVREDEPYADPDYLRGRLIDEGILNPGK